MIFTSLDNIVNSLLLQKSLPIHYYLQFLKYTADAQRELYFSTSRIVNVTELTISKQDYTAQLPCDYVDWTKVGVKKGQFIRPIYERDEINRMQAKLPDGQTTTFTNNGNATLPDAPFPFWPGFWLWTNFDDLGENIGRQFGFSAADEADGFKIIQERNQIQFTESFRGCTVVMEYIGDGQCVDNASRVDPQAQAVIEAYADWKFRMHSGDFPMNEIMLAFDIFKREIRMYRARKSDLTITAIKQALYRNYRQSVKT